MGKRSAVCLQRRAEELCCCTEHCSLQRKKLNLLYEDMRSVHENDGTNVGGLWGNGVWCVGGARGLKKYCSAFNSVVLTW